MSIEHSLYLSQSFLQFLQNIRFHFDNSPFPVFETLSFPMSS